MASRIWQKVQGLIHGHKIIAGGFQCNGTSDPTVTHGRGFSVARTSIGLYTVTFDDIYPQLEALGCSLRGADGAGHYVEGGDYSQANSTIQIRAFDGRAPKSMPLDITALREIATNDIQNLAAHGGILASDSDPSLVRVNGATDKALRVIWDTANDTDEVQFPPIPMLPGMGKNDIVVHLLAAMNGTTDTPTIDVQAYAGVGDTEMGGATAAVTGVTPAEYTVTLSAADLTDHPGFLNLALVPGAHTTDALYLYAAWLEYKTLVDLGSDADNVVNFLAHFRNSSIDAG
jgi:hypothetical protein